MQRLHGPELPCHFNPSADKKADSTAKKIAREPGSGVTRTPTATINLLQQGGWMATKLNLFISHENHDATEALGSMTVNL